MTAPTVGRIVHLCSEVGEPRAAIVTHVHENGRVDLTVFERSGLPTCRSAQPFGKPEPGSPHSSWADWPPRT